MVVGIVGTRTTASFMVFPRLIPKKKKKTHLPHYCYHIVVAIWIEVHKDLFNLFYPSFKTRLLNLKAI